MMRIDHDYRPTLTLDLAKAKPLMLDAYETPTLAELAPIIEGKPDVTRLSEISLARAWGTVPNAEDRIFERQATFTSR